MASFMRLTEKDLSAIVGAILAVSRPAAVVLFGSHARGDAHPNSDVDLLVIRHGDFHRGESRRRELSEIYRAVTRACDLPKDIFLFSKAEFDRWKTATNHVTASALKEGRVLYGGL
jgi:uncharacterized protein